MIQSLLQMRDTTPCPRCASGSAKCWAWTSPCRCRCCCARSRTRLRRRPHHLRGQPGFLAALFDDRRTRAYAPSALAADARRRPGKAAAAMLRWGKAGFSTVDSETLERRESACLGCPNLDPASAVQKMVLVGAVTDKVGSRLGGKVCNLCGCVVHKKIRLPTEACPDTHPVKSGLTRWDEPIPAECRPGSGAGGSTRRPCGMPPRRSAISAGGILAIMSAASLRDHHGRRIGVARGDQGHDEASAMRSFQPVHAQARVHHRALVRRRPSRRCRPDGRWWCRSCRPPGAAHHRCGRPDRAAIPPAGSGSARARPRCAAPAVSSRPPLSGLRPCSGSWAGSAARLRIGPCVHAAARRGPQVARWP